MFELDSCIVGKLRYRSNRGASEMFTTKLKLVAFAVLGIIAASIEPAFASVVPAPIVGAGLPALAILGGGYWLIKKVRERR